MRVGIRYTHAGAVLRDHPKGKWIFVHLLNDCGSDRSGIYDEGLANFYLDDLFAFEAVVLVPSRPVQENLSKNLIGPWAVAMHNPVYSMIAKPSSTKYQNSNQWLLEIVAVSMAPAGTVVSRAQAQAYLAATGYSGDLVRISTLRRLGAGLTRANVRFDDHSEDESAAEKYEVVSVRSMVRWLEKNDKLVLKKMISLDKLDSDPVKY